MSQQFLFITLLIFNSILFQNCTRNSDVHISMLDQNVKSDFIQDELIELAASTPCGYPLEVQGSFLIYAAQDLDLSDVVVPSKYSKVYVIGAQADEKPTVSLSQKENHEAYFCNVNVKVIDSALCGASALGDPLDSYFFLDDTSKLLQPACDLFLVN